MMEDACWGESFDLRRLLGNGRMARSGKMGDAVSGERLADSDDDREKPGGLAYSTSV